MSSTLSKRRPAPLQRALIYAATLAAFALVIAVSLGLGHAKAEIAQLRIAQQFGVSYLPIIVAKERGLIEKAAEKAGLPAPKVEWLQLSGAAAMNEALISGSLDLATGGVAPLITTWAKTRGSVNVIGVVALGNVPNVVTTTNPNVKTIKDFTDKDRIALPAVMISFQSQVLHMAAEKGAGRDRQARRTHSEHAASRRDRRAAFREFGDHRAFHLAAFRPAAAQGPARSQGAVEL